MFGHIGLVEVAIIPVALIAMAIPIVTLSLLIALYLKVKRIEQILADTLGKSGRLSQT